MILGEVDQAGATQVIYTSGVNGPDGVISRRHSITDYYLFDPLGSTDRLVDAAGDSTAAYVYSSFGTLMAGAGSSNPLTFIGRWGYYRDASLNLYYVRARYYSPTLARWTAPDVRHPPESPNKYLYALNQPTARIDPSGALSVIPVGNTLSASCYSPNNRVGIGWDFQLDVNAPCDGYIVQEVKVTCVTEPCESCPITRVPAAPTLTYYEAWPVTWGQQLTHERSTFNNIMYTDNAYGTCLPGCGYVRQRGTIKFFCKEPWRNLQYGGDFVGTDELGGIGPGGLPVPGGWTRGTIYGVPNCGDYEMKTGRILSTDNEPAWWSSNPVEGPAYRWFSYEWCCCLVPICCLTCKAEGAPT